MRLVKTEESESKSTACYQCGVRRPVVGMLCVTEVEAPEDKVEFIVFCNWKCLFEYALETVTP